MTETPRDIIAAYHDDAQVGDYDCAWNDSDPDKLLEALSSAGWVLIPRETLERVRSVLDYCDNTDNIAAMRFNGVSVPARALDSLRPYLEEV